MKKLNILTRYFGTSIIIFDEYYSNLMSFNLSDVPTVTTIVHGKQFTAPTKTSFQELPEYVVSHYLVVDGEKVKSDNPAKSFNDTIVKYLSRGWHMVATSTVSNNFHTETTYILQYNPRF